MGDGEFNLSTCTIASRKSQSNCPGGFKKLVSWTHLIVLHHFIRGNCTSLFEAGTEYQKWDRKTVAAQHRKAFFYGMFFCPSSPHFSYSLFLPNIFKFYLSFSLFCPSYLRSLSSIKQCCFDFFQQENDKNDRIYVPIVVYTLPPFKNSRNIGA